MDPGSKAFIILAGGSAVLGFGWWLFRKAFGVPAEDPTASKAKDTWDSPGGDYGAGKDGH
ncbi:MAG TPA: hypothetical protein VIG99_30725 [Myxococcaceae bacterium]